MQYKKYGMTNIDLSVIGFGGMRFRDQSNVDECAALVKYSYDKGITYFDTAPGYGKSEELFGVALKEMKKTRAARPFYVSSKTFGADPGSVRRDLETSLSRMGLEFIDFYHMWCILSPEAYAARKLKHTLREFEKLKAEGLIRHICVSTHMTGAEIGPMLADYPFEGILLGYSAMNFAFRDTGLDAAAAARRGVVVMNPLGGGMIPSHPDRFEFVRTRPDETVVEGALRFIINDPRITVGLVGFSTTAQVDEAIRAIDGFRPLSPAQVSQIRSGIQGAFNEMCTGCRYCEKCPQSIPVSKYMESYNHMLLSGKPVDMLNRLKWHWSLKTDDGVLASCTQCGLCEQNCTQKLPIIERLARIRREGATV